MNRSFPLVLACAALFAGVCHAQVAGKANEGYQTAQGRAAVAKSLADSHREQSQHPRELIDAMGLKMGQTVVDVGTGVGFMIPYLSHAVGEHGRVIAEDIAQDFLDAAKLRSQTQNLTNVSFILGSDRDPKLPADTADAILVLDVYHHFDYPETMLGHIGDCLVTGGKLFIVDYYKRPNAMPGGRAMEHIRLDMDDVVHEIEDAGFRSVSTKELIPGVQYIAVFEKKR